MNEWIENFERYLNIKNLIVIDGNIVDLSLHNDEYIRNIDIVEKIYMKNYKNIIKYNYLDGVDFSMIDIDVLYEILSKYNNERYYFENGNIKIREKVARNRINSLDNNSMEINLSINLENDLKKIEKDFCEMIDFFELVYFISKLKNININFLITMGDSIFGPIRINEHLMSEEKRMYELLINSVDNFNDNKIIIALKSIKSFPPQLYLKNPKIKVINIPIPSRVVREEFFLKNRNNFNILDKEIVNFIDSLEGLTLLEMDQISKLTRLYSEKEINYKDILSQFLYGSKKNVWSEMNTNKLYDIEETLKKRVKSQDMAVKKVSSIMLKAYTGMSGIQYSSKNIKPKGILFFVGPTGVGKTELAKSIAEFIFGDEQAYVRFDMSEYNSEHSDQRLIGAPPGYIGYESGGQLTNKIKEKPFSVILFDEIEKAHNRILDKFLQILEDGRLTDGKGETVYFSESIIIFTSNIGTDKIFSVENKEDCNDVRELFKQEVIKYFTEKLGRPEILNRIGIENIIAFDFIKDKDILTDIVISKLNENINKFLWEKYNRSSFKIKNEKNTISKILEDMNVMYGVRGALNKIEEPLIESLSKFLFFNKKAISNSDILAIYNESKGEFEFCLI